MNKSAIQKFAIQARRDLIEQVKQRAYQYGVEQDGYGDSDADAVSGRVLTPVEKSQRQELIRLIQDKGYDQVMEEVAYTWFNRVVALRFMEVNNYLPTHIRVFSDASGAFKPEILSDVLHLELEGLSRERVSEYLEQNDDEGLYRYLLLTQCNALSDCLPRMFEPMGSYTELLLPNNILRLDSVLGHMVSDIPEEDWQDAVQIIGWMYQYYNTDLNALVYDGNMSKSRIPKELLPAATTIYTPDWAIRYMVENSLGRIFINSRILCAVGSDQWTEVQRIEQEKELAAQMGWKYYLPEAEQTPEVRAQLRSGQWLVVSGQSLTELKVIDPCMGSGHILVYAFDVLMQIYTASGWDQREAAQSILKNNLFGLDIDDRAAQLAYFAVMMKARQYDRRLFSRGIQPNVMAIRASNGIPDMAFSYFHQGDPALKEPIRRIVQELQDAKEYGSILEVQPEDWTALYQRFDEIFDDIDMMRKVALEELLPLVKCAEWMAQKYDVVVTNPPYLGSPNMNDTLLSFLKRNYSAGKSDLFSTFMLRNMEFSKRDGFVSMITMSAWMFQARFEDTRRAMSPFVLQNMVHLGTRAFDAIGGEVVQTTAFVYSKVNMPDYITHFIRLTEPKGEAAKEKAFYNIENHKSCSVASFNSIPCAPIAYYIANAAISAFQHGEYLKDRLQPKQGTSTGNDEEFVRSWYEISNIMLKVDAKSLDDAFSSNKKYFPLDKGGEFRKWYGNNERVIKFDYPSYLRLLEMGNHLPSRQFYFQHGLTWSKIASELSVRFDPDGYIFSSVGLKGFPAIQNSNYILGFMNSNIGKYFVGIISPGMSIVSGDIEKIPLIVNRKDDVDPIVDENIRCSRDDWDSYEFSWDFKRNPLV